MARKRMIDPDFWSDEKLGECTRDERLFFMGLISNADDEGIGRANPKYLKSIIFPYDEDVTSKDIDGMLICLHSKKLIIVYEVDGQSFYILPKFAKHQTINKPTPSKLPRPNTDTKNDCEIPLQDDYCSTTTPLQEDYRLKEVKIKEDNIKRIEDEDEDNRRERPETFFQNNIGLITPHVAESIAKWIEDGIDEQLILKLMQEAVENDARNWKYINTAIKNQCDKNIKTLADYLVAEADRKRKQEEKPNSKYKPNQPIQIMNFKQRDYASEDINTYYSNVK